MAYTREPVPSSNFTPFFVINHTPGRSNPIAWIHTDTGCWSRGGPSRVSWRYSPPRDGNVLRKECSDLERP